ncbi:hypothetical protein GO493_20800 [Chitinophaga sp. ysch24]|uniref:Uncharacterized protein n=1 Tax=Chitinophaga tropicalis TaxID=2683588 RepID=A0A7K1U8M4_9BACT|nr:hypothetical protein [Chitinophaga tropicalis]
MLGLHQISLYRLPIHVFIIILCLIIALLSKFQKNPPHYLNSFIIYIILTITIEMFAWWYSLHRKNNLIFYNFYTIPNITYLLYLVRSFLSNSKVIRMLDIFIIVYPGIALVNIIRTPHTFNTYAFLIGCTLVVIATICYFYERIKYPGPQSLLKDPTFWISTGLLFYYTCSLPLNGILNFISNMPFYVYTTIYFINVVINIILYLLFSISFLCNLISRKSS